MTHAFVAYPSDPPEIGMTINSALEQLHRRQSGPTFEAWEQLDIPGRFIEDPILAQINEGDFLVADVTYPNFNVAYEIGFAIGRNRRAYLIRLKSLVDAENVIREAGIFDTLGYQDYTTSANLELHLSQIDSFAPIPIPQTTPSSTTPVYIVLPKHKTDFEILVQAKLRKSSLDFRSFDAEESGRMAAPSAIADVATSHGVVIPLVPSRRDGSAAHNLRCAFVAGLAKGLEVPLLILQFDAEQPVPLDYRDLVKLATGEKQIESAIASFAPVVYQRMQRGVRVTSKRGATLLSQLAIGASAAENEMSELAEYYLEKEEFHRVCRGEAQLVVGRKGSGKTALFVHLRDQLLIGRKNIVVDLKPEGFQLLKFKDVVVNHLEQGTKEHTLIAFWEYLLYLEVCHKILSADQDFFMYEPELLHPYKQLAAAYDRDPFITEADFAERLMKLTNRIVEGFKDAVGDGKQKLRLSSAELTNILYQHDAKTLRESVLDYLKAGRVSRGVWILFDNIDKGWPASGLTDDDVIITRCLLEAVWKVQKYVNRANVKCNGVIFLRNDVYELLVDRSSDRGKLSRVLLDWTDPALLRELLRLRFARTASLSGLNFQDAWSQVAESHVGIEESSSFLINRCLMRPRALLGLLQHCRSHAINLSHAKIESDDFLAGWASLSTDLITEVCYEIRDVCPGAGDSILYEFIGVSSQLRLSDVCACLERVISDDSVLLRVVELLLWHGVLGIVKDDGSTAYIYNVQYKLERLRVHIDRFASNDPLFELNPAFWDGLEVARA